MQPKPRIFIGSSVEGLPIAEHVQLGLDYHAECTLWSQGVFGLSGGTLESLLKAVKEYDFAVLVLTPDDLRESGEIRSQDRLSISSASMASCGAFTASVAMIGLRGRCMVLD